IRCRLSTLDRLPFSPTLCPSTPSHLPASIFSLLHRRRPPRSTPFPTRRSSDLASIQFDPILIGDIHRFPFIKDKVQLDDIIDKRSEEHTSELQSRENLVCRLLLEKKKVGGSRVVGDPVAWRVVDRAVVGEARE